MHRLIARILGTATAAGIAISPVAAQANTRAGDNRALYAASASQQPGAQQADQGKRKRGSGWWSDSIVGQFLLGATGVALVMVLWDNSGNSSESRGTAGGGFQSNGAN